MLSHFDLIGINLKSSKYVLQMYTRSCKFHILTPPKTAINMLCRRWKRRKRVTRRKASLYEYVLMFDIKTYLLVDTA